MFFLETDGARGRDEPARLPLERQAERGTFGIVDVVLLESKEMAVSAQAVDDANAVAVQLHGERIEFFGIKFHRGAFLLFRVLRLQRHRANVRPTREGHRDAGSRG